MAYRAASDDEVSGMINPSGDLFMSYNPYAYEYRKKQTFSEQPAQVEVEPQIEPQVKPPASMIQPTSYLGFVVMFVIMLLILLVFIQFVNIMSLNYLKCQVNNLVMKSLAH
jgi:hypothetical protein